MRTFAGLLAGFVVTALCGATVAAQTAPPPDTRVVQEHGSSLYGMYCASCHGATARGDGPLADLMKRRPPNLTEILKRNNGVYPKEQVFQIIDGRQPVRGHGGPDMPVWGDAFKRSIDVGGEEAIRNRIQAIVDYLEIIQMRLANNQ
jgi:mono/diheme cytochrome c family protein